MKKAALLATLAALAVSIPQTSYAHGYNRDDDGHPLRLVAYVLHPVGLAMEKLIFKPIHYIVTSDAEFVGTPAYEWFGHEPEEKHVVMTEAPAPEVVYQEVPVEVIREVPVSTELQRYELSTDLLFAPGKDILTDAGKAQLDAAVTEITSKYPGKRINIEGHTDTDPIVQSKWRSNWELGAARALAVLHYLEDQHGVQGNLMSATTYSYHQPVAGNETAEGKSENRRAAIVIYAEPAPAEPAPAEPAPAEPAAASEAAPSEAGVPRASATEPAATVPGPVSAVTVTE